MQRGTLGSFRNRIRCFWLRQNRLKVRFPPPPLKKNEPGDVLRHRVSELDAYRD